MESDLILAIDNGTQSVRSLLFDPQGNLVASSQVHLEACFSQHPAWAEQHPDCFWECLRWACQKLWLQGTVSKEAVGLGLHPGFGTAVSEMTRVGRTFEPDPETRGVYDGLYQPVYKKM